MISPVFPINLKFAFALHLKAGFKYGFKTDTIALRLNLFLLFRQYNVNGFFECL